MSRAFSESNTRRAFVGGLATAALAPALVAARGRPVITILGDSITAGYGLPAAAALPAQLQRALEKRGVPADVRGAGVSGDTTAGGLARVDFSVQSDTALCIVELGGNDLLQGLDPKTTRANLEGIIRRLKARKIRLLVLGLRAPFLLNAGYAREFNSVFSDAARAGGAPLYPDLLAGVEGNWILNQRDHIHPNALGVKIIASRLAPAVVRALRSPA